MRKSKLIRCILLFAVFLFACCFCGCTQKRQTENVGGSWGVYPVLSVKWDTTSLSINQADVEVSFGLFPRNMDSNIIYKSEGMDEILCFALYYCKPDDDSLLAPHHTEIENYKNIAGHYFIKEIDYTDALHGRYKMWYDLRGHSHFQHSETLTIPRSVLEFCGDEVALRLAVIGKMDDKTVLAWNTTSIIFSYDILDNEQVVFNSVRGVL